MFTDNFRIMFRRAPCTSRPEYTLQRQSIFGWWRFVTSNGELYLKDDVSYRTYNTYEKAADQIYNILLRENTIKVNHKWRPVTKGE